MHIVGLSIFGPAYSGLEYDYRGLQRVYRKLGNQAKLQEYQSLFDEWLQQRQSLRLVDSTESDMMDEIEPAILAYGSVGEAQQSIIGLLEDYRTEFASILGEEEDKAVYATQQCGQLVDSRSASPVISGETSRSTGY